MNSLDVAKYISKKCNKDMPTAIEFIENELQIGLTTSYLPSRSSTPLIYILGSYNVFINQQAVLYHCRKNNAKGCILALWKYFTEEQQEKLIQSVQKSINYNNNINMNQNMVKSESQANNKNDINVSPTFNISNNVNNENIINISTLSQLSNQVEQNTNIENKKEIKDLITKLEDAKDENDEESYFDLFFKLTEKLENTGLIPAWLAKSAKFAKKFIDK